MLKKTAKYFDINYKTSSACLNKKNAIIWHLNNTMLVADLMLLGRLFHSSTSLLTIKNCCTFT